MNLDFDRIDDFRVLAVRALDMLREAEFKDDPELAELTKKTANELAVLIGTLYRAMPEPYHQRPKPRHLRPQL